MDFANAATEGAGGGAHLGNHATSDDFLGNERIDLFDTPR
jgi:hypothetical protein